MDEPHPPAESRLPSSTGFPDSQHGRSQGFGAVLSQPLIYLTLGLCWALTAFGRIVSMLSDDGNTLYNWAWLALEMAFAGLVLAYALGFVA